MTRAQLVGGFFIVLLVFVVHQTIKLLSPFLMPLFWAAILAFAFYPVHRGLMRVLGQRAVWAAGFSTLIVLLSFAPMVALITVRLADETAGFYDQTADYLRSGRFEQALSRFRRLPFVKDMERRLISEGGLTEQAKDQISESAGAVGGAAAAFTRNLIVFAVNLVLGVVFLFFFFKDGPRIFRFFYEIIPLEEAYKQDVISQIRATFEAVIHGQLLSAFIQGALASLIFIGLQLPFPFTFAAVIFVFAFIPLLGAPMVWVPVALVLLVQGDPIKAALLAVLGAAVIGPVDNIVHPMMIGNRTKLPFLLMLLGILGGMKMYGLLGIFLGPALMTTFFVLIRIYRQKYVETDRGLIKPSAVS
jgi:predicted PurR-regulated permease PerM